MARKHPNIISIAGVSMEQDYTTFPTMGEEKGLTGISLHYNIPLPLPYDKKVPPEIKQLQEVL
jgi:hypothetical protein